MFGLFKSKEQKMFDGCDFNLAAQVLVYTYCSSVIPNDLGQLLDQYLDNPNYKTALEITKKYPDFMVYFEQCKPGGLYTRIGLPKN